MALRTNAEAQTAIFGLTLGQPVPIAPLGTKQVSEPCLDPKKGAWRHPGVAEQLVYVTALQDSGGHTSVGRIWAWWNRAGCSDALPRPANTLRRNSTSTTKVVTIKNGASPGGQQISSDR